MTRIFHWFFMGKMDLKSGFDIRLVFTLPPRDSTLQYKRCVHIWKNFPCIITLSLTRIIACAIFLYYLYINTETVRGVFRNLSRGGAYIFLSSTRWAQKKTLKLIDCNGLWGEEAIAPSPPIEYASYKSEQLFSHKYAQ